MGFFVRSSIDGYASNIGSTFTQAWDTTSSRSSTSRHRQFQGSRLRSPSASTFSIAGSIPRPMALRLDNVVLNGQVVADSSGAFLSGFNYDPATGACSADLKGTPGATFKFVEAADLDFGNPDQDPVPLTSGPRKGTPVGTLPAATAVSSPTATATPPWSSTSALPRRGVSFGPSRLHPDDCLEHHPTVRLSKKCFVIPRLPTGLALLLGAWLLPSPDDHPPRL